MPKIGELVTAKAYAKHSGLSISTVQVYGSNGKIKRKNVGGRRYRYVWDGRDRKTAPGPTIDLHNGEARYKCELCGKTEKKCTRMIVLKMIDEFLVGLDSVIGCKC